MTSVRYPLGAILLAAVLALLLWIFPTGIAQASEFDEFGFESVTAEETSSLAGRHPDLATEFVLNHKEDSEIRPGGQFSSGRAEEVSLTLPPGLVGNPTAFPRCSTGQFESFGNCPIDSQVGIVKVLINGNTSEEVLTEPLYNLEPPHDDEIARFGFVGVFFPLFVDVNLRTASDYGVTATVHSATGQAPLISARAVLWGVPADPVHNEERLTPFEALACGNVGKPCLVPGENRESGLVPEPFLTNPTACEEQQVGFSATSYELPGQVREATAPLPPVTTCEQLSFDPRLQVEPTNRRAGAPTGLKTVLEIPQSEGVNTAATSAMRDARVTLPEGMTIAAGAADGLQACSAQQVGLGTEGPSGCPDAAKLGTATFTSPDLPQPLHGAIYQRTPEPGHLFRIWLVSDELGVHLKIPGEVQPDPQTGRLTASFAETPQLPVETIDLEFRGGPRAPLKNPDACGTYPTRYELTPWSGGAPVLGTSPMTIDEGCGAKGFSPALSAGVTKPLAGAFSPLVLKLTQREGEENLADFEATLPPGELAKLAEVPLCPDAAAASGACPAASQIGSLTLATGPGPQPLWIPQPGKEPTALYLAGPYKGDPYSAVAKVPAQAGPFDLGTVVVRNGLHVDPETAQVTVQGDPLPQILQGVPITYRTIHVAVDRPGFALNPTSCEPMAAGATFTSAQGAIAQTSNRFQVGECAALAFKPKLSLSLKGQTGRAGHPALRAELKMPPGGANISRVQVGLPHALFLDEGNLDQVCLQAELKAGTCPKSSVYGHVKAWTPLLDQPLEGNVYLGVGYGHKLPDLVAELNGQIRVLLHARIDTTKADGLRSTFELVPDAPVPRFVLEMKGGRKYGLLENHEDLCAKPRSASARFVAHNGRVAQLRPRLRSRCG